MSRRPSGAVAATAPLLAALALAAAGPGVADSTSYAERLRQGLALAAAGRCEEALPLLAAESPTAPAPAAVALVDVRCRMRLQRYQEVVEPLRDLREREPELAESGELDLYLGVASYHLGDRATAEEALARAAERLPERAEPPLYQGVLAFEDGEDEAALSSLDRARALDPEGSGLIAAYYAGVARARLGRLDEARQDAEQVLVLQKEGLWASRAQALTARLDALQAPRAWRVEGSLGFEHDDNVVLRGEDATLPNDISDEADERLAWFGKGSLELLRGRAGTLGVTADYAGTRHLHLNDFDVQYPAGSLWWQRGVAARSGLRAEYRYGYAWVDEDPFVETHSLGVSYLHAWPEAGRTSARLRGFGYRYAEDPDDVPDGTGAPGDPCPPGLGVCGPPGVDESERLARSGVGYEASLAHRWRAPGWEDGLEVTPSLRFQQYFAQGRDFDYLRLEARIAARVRLPFDVYASAEASYAFRPFLAKSSLPDLDTLTAGEQFEPAERRRRDHIVQVSAALDRELFGPVSAEVRYTYTDNQSNQPSSQYDRHIVGGYLTLRFGN